MLLSSILTEGWTTDTNAFAQTEICEEIYVEYPKIFESVTGEAVCCNFKRVYMDCDGLPVLSTKVLRIVYLKVAGFRVK